MNIVELKRRPFLLEEARAAGFTRRILAGKSWRRIGPSLYCSSDWREDTLQLLQAWHRRYPDAVFTGLTAAWLYRLDVDACHPIEIAVPTSSGIRSGPALLVHRTALDPVKVRGLPASTLSRTFADLRRRLPRIELLVLADEAVRRKLGRFDELAEPAESPMETRIRWLLLQAGLPCPEVQADLRSDGRFIGRADLLYRDARLVVEYDGDNHRDRLVEDNRRQNLLIDAGYRILRYTASDVYQRPEHVISEVRRAVR